MASLYRKPKFHTDPKTGERTKTLTDKWWGQFRDADGRLRRHPLATDKLAAQAMLAELVQRVEREKAGLIDRTDEQRKRPLKEHVADFEKYLYNKGISDKQAGEVATMLKKIVAGCKWKRISDIDVGSLLEYFKVLKRQGRAAQTRNNYLRAAKQFTRWLVRDQRTPNDPLQHAQGANAATDRRHDRRPLSDDEFARMVAAAEVGGPVESISGPDRAMLYKLAAWTGFRRTELGSLTPTSLNLNGDPPAASVVACYAKGKRADSQPLHEELAKQLKAWLKKKKLAKGQLLFPISGKVPGGIDRKTAKMVRKDLEAARAKWLKEAKTTEDRARREQTDFLCYQNHEDRFADFHACRHLFISNLEKSGVSPKMAQTLARHKDIRLTLGIYTHIETEAKTKAIGSLPAPPSGGGKRAS